MAQFRRQAWLTYVTRNDHVTHALVLAESLRRTETSRRIGVITSGNVSQKGRNSLRQAYDDLFFLERLSDKLDIREPKNGKFLKRNDEIEAKIFAFSLDIFEKCVFLEPNSLFLENGDKLFENEGRMVSLMNKNDTVISGYGYHSDYFLIMPCVPFAEYLEEQFRMKIKEEPGKNGFKESLMNFERLWTKNNFENNDQIDMRSNLNEEDKNMENVIMNFCVEKGQILNKENWKKPSIIQFVNGPLAEMNFVEKLDALKQCPHLGLTEKAIIQSWLKLWLLKVNPNTRIPRFSKHPQLYSSTTSYNEPIAIIGISCRLPGANNLEEFWNLLYTSSSGVCNPPPFRWKKEHCIAPVTEKERKTHAGFLNTNVDEFDCKFFGVSPKEAVFMDPQTRLLQEVMWESLENGGVDPSSLYGSHTGIFTGSWMNDYKDIVNWSSSRDFFRTYMGNSIGASASRLSFLLGLTGPCIATESGCSSAIVAVDMAVKSLRTGETNLALAGGVNLLLHPFTSNIMDYVIAPDGRCKTFDAKADGFGRAEGCGFLVLKRLSDAMKDRDHIWAMIRGSAVSQEGISRSLGTPTVHCEALAMQLAMKNGGVKPDQVSFVETHGTGTSVGDPMEVAAIAKAYHAKNRKTPLVIGSVKTNVGHTESCSGITGIIKTVLAMKHEMIPKHLNLETLNPDINLEMIPAVIPMEPMEWPKVKGEPRLAGVSSFGITGTDGHVILQEPPEMKYPKFTLNLERPLHILKISGKTPEALEELVKRYGEYLGDTTKDTRIEKFSDVAFTANTGRASFDHRAFILASDFGTASEALQSSQLIRGEMNVANEKICFLFTGQGSQYQGMARSLYESSPVFRHHFDHCSQILEDSYRVSLEKVLWSSGEESTELKRTIYSQTSIFCVEYCLLKLWESWGLQPDFVLGHSLGEFCAAVASGHLTFQDALKMVAIRSQLIDDLPQGSMLVLKATKNKVEDLMKTSGIFVDFAAVNSSEQTVVAGDTDKITQLLEYCNNEGIKGIILEATHAFHSSLMYPIMEEYRRSLEGITLGKGYPGVQYISGMEGRVMDEIDVDYWVRHTREKVNFMEACQTLSKLGCQACLEIGPHPVLSTFVLQNIEDPQITCYPSLRRNKDDWESILTSLGKMWVNGFKIDWEGFDDPYQRSKISSLPFYPFQRKSYWVETNEAVAVAIHPLIGAPLNTASNLNIFQNDLNVSTVPFLKDHCVGTKILFPGAGFTEMCLSAGYCVANFLREKLDKPSGPIYLENLKIGAPLELKEGKFCRLQVIVDLPEIDLQKETSGPEGLEEDNPESSKKPGFRCKVFHKNNTDIEASSAGKWVEHADAMFYPVVGRPQDIIKDLWDADKIKDLISSKDPMQMDGFYKRIDNAGLKFGDAFRSLEKQWFIQEENTGEGFGVEEVVTQLKCPDDFDKYILHPLVIDAMFQTQILAQLRIHKSEALRVPVQVGRLVLFKNLGEKGEEPNNQVLYVHAKSTSKDKCSVILANSKFEPLAFMEDLELLETNVKTIQSVLEQQNSKIPDCWEEIWKPVAGPHDKRMELHEMGPLTSSVEYNEKVMAQTKVVPDDAINAKKLDKLVTLYVLRALMQLGWEPELGEELKAKDFCEKYKIKQIYHQLVYFYLGMLKDELKMLGQIGTEASCWRVIKIPYKMEEEITEELIGLHKELVQDEKIKYVVRIYENVSRSLTKVLKGDESPLNILFPQDPEMQDLSAEAYYQLHPGRMDMISKGLVSWGALWRRTRDMNGGPESGKVMRVLEVGAGTGSMSYAVIKELAEVFGKNKFEYYYTDISASFFARADKRLDEYRQNIKFLAFNVEESPLSQGIPLNYFDCVSASDVLHATRDLKECVRNLRMCLRPKGLLSFSDTLIPDKGITYVFGLLEGYWRFEDFGRRPHHACISTGEWRELLMECGFTDFYCCEGYFGVMGCMSAEANGLPGYEELEGPLRKEGKRWIIFGSGEERDMEVVLKVGRILEGNGCRVEVVLPDKEMEEQVEGERILEILNGGEEEEELQGIIFGWGMKMGVRDQRKLALPFLHISKWIMNEKKPPRLYVFTREVQVLSEDCYNPSPATLLGMAKSLKNENSDLVVRCVDLEGCGRKMQENDLNVEVDQFLFELAMHKETKEKERVQVAYRDRVRYEPRLNKVVVQQQSKSDLSLPPSTDRYQLKLPETRSINDLEYVVLGEEPVGDMEVEVKTQAYALNFRDIFAILKPSLEFEKINGVGLDFAGVVTKVGKGVEPEKLKLGDRVFGVNFKEVQLPSHLTCKAEDLLRVPEGMTFSEAATLPAVFATSFYCLVNVAKLKEGETVLIHTGSGGVGLSAIQVARMIGAEVITTAGSPRKRAYLRNLGIKYVFHSRNTDYRDEILKVTDGKGVDVILNSITGPGFKEASLKVCKENGRFVEMSKLAVWSEDEVKGLRPDVEYSIVDLTKLDKSVWMGLQDKTDEYLRSGKIKAIPFVKFDALRIRQAFQYFQKAKHIGKIVVTMPEVKTEAGKWTVKVSLFNGDSTYLITGGLGGIGFEVCKWMLENGATDIVLVGRSQPKAEIQSEIDKLNGRKGLQITVKLCDVGNFMQCKTLFEDLTSGQLKPLRGIHHCAGVLRDNLYANQTWETFMATYNPKIEGSWNLHELTKGLNSLEHFIFYSSLTALVGTPGQANHASANCFEDAFARHRYSMGLPATTLNWGQWAQVGCAKEVNVVAVLPVSVARMLNGLEEVLRSARVQTAYGEFESLNLWSMVCPSFKYYLDERLLKSDVGSQDQAFLLQSAKFWQEIEEAPSTAAKMEVVINYMRVILRTALRMDPDEPIKEDANMQDLGVDSLMLIELRNSIQSLLGSRINVTANMLKDCQTIRQLATVIVNKIQDTEESETPALSPEELESLLRQDCILPEDIKPLEKNAVKSASIKTVLLTGVSGQLGPYILASICGKRRKEEDPPQTLEKVICLIRTKGEESPKDKLVQILESMQLINEVDMSRVECLKGDLTSDNFGLLQKFYDDLCECVDAVVHLAAKSNHVESYRKIDNGDSDVRSVNVGGTLRILKFAVTRKTKSIYHASSILTIFGGNETNTLSDAWPEVDDIKTLTENGATAYPCSKFVSEILMRQATERGVPCKIFRFPWIMGDSRTGRLNFHSNHYILRFITYLKLKAMPSSPLPAIVLPVDKCADWSLRLFWDDMTPSGSYNITHPKPDLEVEFVRVAKEDFGVDIELVDWKGSDFIERLYATDMPLESLKEIYEDMDRIVAVTTSKAFQAIQGYLNYPDTFFKGGKLEEFLGGIRDDVSSSTEIIRRDLNFVKEAGYFKKFGL